MKPKFTAKIVSEMLIAVYKTTFVTVLVLLLLLVLVLLLVLN